MFFHVRISSCSPLRLSLASLSSWLRRARTFRELVRNITNATLRREMALGEQVVLGLLQKQPGADPTPTG